MRPGAGAPSRLILSLILAAAFSTAAKAAPVAPPPTVDELVAKYVAARGGLKKIQAVRTLRQTGRVYAGAGREALVKREIKRPALSRFEFTVQGVTAVYVSDGRQGWRVSPFDGVLEPELLPDEAVNDAAEQADLDGPLVDWKAKGHHVELDGREVVDGREAYRLKVTLGSGAARYEYLDVETLFRIRSDVTRQVRGRTVRVETRFGDFRKTSGLLFPHRIEVAAAGRPQRLRIVVDRVEVNPRLSDARFQLKVPSEP